VTNTINTHTLASGFGVEVDVDLRQAADDQVLGRELKQLFLNHHLLLFRHQQLTQEQHVQVGRHFGPVLLHAHDGVSYVSNDAAKGGLGSSELAFHSDLAFSPHPYLGLSLYAIEVIDGATCTRFADATRALTRLPVEVRKQLAGRDAVHCIGLDPSHRNRLVSLPAGAPNSRHPVILQHPLSGKSILYVSMHQTDSIVGLPSEAGEMLIQECFRVLYSTDNIYEHAWCSGDVIIWDNLALQHARPDVSHCGPRTLHRFALGEKSFFELYPEFEYEQRTGYVASK
jgi:taurine dioxygenase